MLCLFVLFDHPGLCIVPKFSVSSYLGGAWGKIRLRHRGADAVLFLAGYTSGLRFLLVT